MYFVQEYFSFMSSLAHIISHEHDNKLTWFVMWISLLFTFFITSFNAFERVVKVIIKSTNIPRLNQWRLVNALWRVLFSCLCLAVYQQRLLKDMKANSVSNIITAASEVFSEPYPKACNMSSVTHEEGGPVHVLWYYVAPLSFFLHQILILLPSSGDSLNIFLMVCFSLFLHATYSLRCMDLGVKVLFLLALDVGSRELARACSALKSRRKGYKGPSAPVPMQLLNFSLFLLHVTIRLVIDFYIYPTILFALPYLTETEESTQLPTAYINIFLITYFPRQILCSPVRSVLEVIARPKGVQKQITFWSVPSVLLLPYSSSLLLELREIQMHFQKRLPLSSAEIRSMRQKLLSEGKKTPNEPSQVLDQSGGLLSVVKCMIALKKKMRHRYERKFAREVESPFGEAERENNGDASASQDTPQSDVDDVTDIFIPVPNVSQSSKFVHESKSGAVSQDPGDEPTGAREQIVNSQACSTEESDSEISDNGKGV